MSCLIESIFVVVLSLLIVYIMSTMYFLVDNTNSEQFIDFSQNPNKKYIIYYFYKKTCPSCIRFSSQVEPELKTQLDTLGIKFHKVDLHKKGGLPDSVNDYIDAHVKTVPHLMGYDTSDDSQYTYEGQKNLTDILNWINIEAAK